MAIQDTDLLVVQRPGTQDLYKLEIGSLPIPDDVDVDLGYTPAVDKGTVTNTAGTDAEIPVVGVNAGLMEPDQAIKLLGIEVGAQVNVAPVTIAPNAPTGEDGDLWYNTSDGRIYVYFDDGNTEQWVDASPIESGGSDFSGSYNDLTDKPDIPDSTSDLTNDSGFITTADLPTVGDGTITIYESDGTTEVGSFTVNQTGATDISLPVIASPTGFVKLDDEGTQQDITGGGGLSVLGGITSEFGTDTAQLGNIAPLNDWSVYPARS